MKKLHRLSILRGSQKFNNPARLPLHLSCFGNSFQIFLFSLQTKLKYQLIFILVLFKRRHPRAGCHKNFVSNLSPSTDDSFDSCTGNSLEILFCIWIFFQVRIGCPFTINGWSCLHRLNVIILKTKLGVVMFCKKSKMGLHLVFELFYHRYTHVTVADLNWALGLGLGEAGREAPKGSCSCRWHPQDI